jgi:hypothetical protein
VLKQHSQSAVQLLVDLPKPIDPLKLVRRNAETSQHQQKD